LIESMSHNKDEKAMTYVPETSDAPQAQEPAAPPPGGMPKQPKKRRRWLVVAIIAVAVVAVILALPKLVGGTKNVYTPGVQATYTVARGNLTVTLNGSGTLQPADSYTITSLISGDILTAPYEEGDIVEKDAVLYTVDSSDVTGSVEQAQNAVEQRQTAYEQALKDLENLKLKAGGDGIVAGLDVKVGDEVTAGQTIGVVRDTSTMVLKVMFQRDFAKTLSVGQSAVVYTDNIYEQYEGTITKISTIDTVVYDNVIGREVTIEVKNPGAFFQSQTANATINGLAGLVNGELEFKYEGYLTAPANGTVQKIAAAEGTRVTKGQVVVVLSSDAVNSQVQQAKNALEDAKLALQTQLDRVGEYTIKSPISGTIVQKDHKAGDKIESGTKLCTIFDLSYLTLVLNVDELDIKNIKPGQAVTITADAAPGVVYNGVVTKININGTTQNGVTSYPITIKIEETEGLLPGMNVDATIVIESLTDVLTVPVTAVVRNNFVLVRSPEADNQPAEPGVPAGFVYRKVTLGPASDDAIVIIDGLEEGDVVAVLDNTPSSYSMNPFMAGGGSGRRPEDGGPRGETQSTTVVIS
jgi:HlyD family secretion protein